jgi:hypothetical protein
MVWESPEGIAEYKRIGKEYPQSVLDKDFTAFMHKIAWDPNKREIIQEITRIRLADDSEFLIHDSLWEGHDKLYGNRDKRYRGELGVYEGIEKQVTRVLNEEKSEFEERVTVGRKEMKYSIPFTKAALEELHKRCNDKGARMADRTHYYVLLDGGTVITVETYSDFLNGRFDDLYKYGKIPTNDEDKLITTTRKAS